MGVYTFYIEDDRYAVPTLEFVTAANEAEVRGVARRRLGEPHHRSVEVLDGERLLFRLRAGAPVDDATRPAAT